MTFAADRILRRWRSRTRAGIVTVTIYDAGSGGFMNRQRLSYILELEHTEIFRGADIGVPAGKSLDSDEVLAAVVDFLSLRPGDTDSAYVADTEEQLSFADACGEEELSLMSSEMFEHTCLEPHHEPTSGEAKTVEEAQAVLAYVSTRAGELTRDLEDLQTQLETADLDSETLADIADVLDSAAAVRTSADRARESFTARHSRIAEAMRATDHPARSDFYRG